MDKPEDYLQRQLELRQWISKKRTLQWLTVLLMVAIAGATIWAVTIAPLTFSVTEKIILTVFGSTITVLAWLITHVLGDRIKERERVFALEHVNIDILAAIERGLGTIFSDSLREFKIMDAQIADAESAMAKAEAVSKFYADFQALLTKLYPEMQLIQAIDSIVATSAESQRTQTNVAQLIEFAEKRGPRERST